MIIAGLQKLTLLDYPGKVACTVFTPGCNLRCPYCHNATFALGKGGGEITLDEFFAFLKKRESVLDGVCVTGGEPLMQKDLERFLKDIKNLGLLVKLDTNGFYPQKLARLIEGGAVDYIAMDIKAPAEKYPEVTGAEDADVSLVKESVKIILGSGVKYEFRTTAVKELLCPEDFYDMAKLIDGAGAYFIQNFVDSGDIIKENLHPFSKEELGEAKKFAEKVLPFVSLRGV